MVYVIVAGEGVNSVSAALFQHVREEKNEEGGFLNLLDGVTVR